MSSRKRIRSGFRAAYERLTEIQESPWFIWFIVVFVVLVIVTIALIEVLTGRWPNDPVLVQ